MLMPQSNEKRRRQSRAGEYVPLLIAVPVVLFKAATVRSADRRESMALYVVTLIDADVSAEKVALAARFDADR